MSIRKIMPLLVFYAIAFSIIIMEAIVLMPISLLKELYLKKKHKKDMENNI